MTFADYSAGRLTGEQLKAAGFTGSVRYLGTPGRAKNTTPLEVASHLAAGLEVHGVYEHNTMDWATGYAGGVAAGEALLADANRCGLPASSALFVCADRHLTTRQGQQFRTYVLGARSILGSRCGAYGFGEAIDAVADLGVWLWQCGSRRAIRPGTHLYQRNDATRRVGGIVCDINELRQPLHTASPPQPEQEEPSMQYIACQGLDAQHPDAISIAHRLESGDFIGLTPQARDAALEDAQAGKVHLDWVIPVDWREFDRISQLRRQADQALVTLAAQKAGA
ncbi:glycoside hydrolase domain-containing protein [Sciscionella sediminilitoris]|uniref:glycoside hydrolase domain-containing protein n=1 Tax=Sciscionella sediminilitoris TaxID=1445613 RepID=UPI0004DF6DB0|nr:glycoside hydrolase domain-containing protein [Sciscionella sp. SE31]